ncbi:MAG: molybdopterin-dependent oxidoreductase [Bdellovibrionales bacterium]|nr:molybdopterin-dependent oxidoreductase [Bdellovibrionales bacterium]
MMETFKTTCCYCGVGCGITAKKDRAGRLSIEGDTDHPVNNGMLCSKGMNLHYTVMDQSDRLLYPEMRYSKGAKLQRVTWDQALDRTAAVFKALIDKFGPDSVAFYASGQCLTEEYYVINKLVKGFIGSNNIDTNSRLCMSSAVVGLKMSLGEDSVPVSYDDLEIADCFFVAGANPAWCHPIIWRRIELAREKDPNLFIIVSDPRITQTSSEANLHLQLNPGTDITLHHAIGRCLIEEGRINLNFIRNHSQGFEKYRETVMLRSVQDAANICGVNAKDIRLAARHIGNAKGFITMWTMGLNQSSVGVNKNLSLINLNLITGQIGKPGSGPFSLTGQPNAMGGREVGAMANLMSAHRNMADSIDREVVAKFWGVKNVPDKPGLTATEMFSALYEEKLKAIWIICTNPLISLPNSRAAEEGLKKAKFVVIQDISLTPQTLNFADVVLPAAAWSEKEGTMTNAERRITYLSKIMPAPGEALPDAEIICRFAKKMNYHGFDYESAENIFAEHCASTIGTNIDIGGLNYEILKNRNGVQWPYPKNTNGFGTPRLFPDLQFYTPSKRAMIHSFSDRNESEEENSDFPLVLTTGRIRDQWHTMSKTGKVNKLNQHISESFLEINPQDARERNIQDGNLVNITSLRGNVRVKAKLSSDIKRGLVFLPMHWGKILNSDLNRANNVTHDLVDARSKEPDFKYSRVEVELYSKPKEKIVIVGSGSGAFGFVTSYRELNREDEIVVFGNENTPFYNRILLPDYINGSLKWQQLVKMNDEDAKSESNNFTFHRGVGIKAIDQSRKRLTDELDQVHTYDKLILAMGSRSLMIKDVPSMQGIFTMRTKSDADSLKRYMDLSKGKIVIVGGGLLGIELAASLREIGSEVTIVQRISRLMDRQLDSLGSQLLNDDLSDRGIEIYYNDEINRFLGTERVEGLILKSGLQIKCQAVVIAIGTVPNIELAKESGIETKRGVVVNEYLQTSDPDIFAIGEIAEFKGSLYGITAAAEQQAEIAARYLSGDISKYYKGSLLMNILKIPGLSLSSLGLVECPIDEGYEEVVFIDKAKRYYKKCIIHNDRLVGAILLGDRLEFSEFKNLIENKIELSDKRLSLLRSGKFAEEAMGKIICVCATVGIGNIERKIDLGCSDLKSLCEQSGAGMGCGSCRPEIRSILEKSLLQRYDGGSACDIPIHESIGAI